MSYQFLFKNTLPFLYLTSIDYYSNFIIIIIIANTMRKKAISIKACICILNNVTDTFFIKWIM